MGNKVFNFIIKYVWCGHKQFCKTENQFVIRCLFCHNLFSLLDENPELLDNPKSK